MQYFPTSQRSMLLIGNALSKNIVLTSQIAAAKKKAQRQVA